MMTLRWRPMTAADMDGVVAVAQEAFPDHFEGRRCFEERLTLYPRGCFVLEEESGGVRGYLVAYPWRREGIPPLNAPLGAIPGDADILYLHDLAIAADARGRGQTGPIIDRLVREARADGWQAIALVAVNDAADFWARNGFATLESAEMAARLSSYGADARYMLRDA